MADINIYGTLKNVTNEPIVNAEQVKEVDIKDYIGDNTKAMPIVSSYFYNGYPVSHIRTIDSGSNEVTLLFCVQHKDGKEDRGIFYDFRINKAEKVAYWEATYEQIDDNVPSWVLKAFGETEEGYNKEEIDELLESKVDRTELASVAKSGSYNDLEDIPDTVNKSDVWQQKQISSPENVKEFNNYLTINDEDQEESDYSLLNHYASYIVKKSCIFRFKGSYEQVIDSRWYLRIYHNDNYKQIEVPYSVETKFDEIIEATQGDTIKFYILNKKKEEPRIIKIVDKEIFVILNRVAVLEEKYNNNIHFYKKTYSADHNTVDGFSGTEFTDSNNGFSITCGTNTTNTTSFVGNNLGFRFTSPTRYIKILPHVSNCGLKVSIAFRFYDNAAMMRAWFSSNEFNITYNGITKFTRRIYDIASSVEKEQSYLLAVDFIINSKPDIPIIIDSGFGDSYSGFDYGIVRVKIETISYTNFSDEDINIPITGLTSDYNDLDNIPTFKTINNVSILGSGNIATNKGTITGITMNGISKGTNGNVNLGNVVTSITFNGNTQTITNGNVTLTTPTTSSVTSGSTTPITSGGVYTALQSYAKNSDVVKKSDIDELISSFKNIENTNSTNIPAIKGYIYRINNDSEINSLNITLPTSDLIVGDTCKFYFTTVDDDIDNIKFDISGGNILKENNFEIKANTIHEVTAFYNGFGWIVSVKYLTTPALEIINFSLRYPDDSRVQYSPSDNGTLPRKINYYPGPHSAGDTETIYFQLDFNKSIHDNTGTYNLFCRATKADFVKDTYGSNQFDDIVDTRGYVSFIFDPNAPANNHETTYITWKGPTGSRDILVAEIYS